MLAWLSGMRCRLAHSPATISCSSKSRLVLTFLVLPFLYLLTQVIPDKFQKSSKRLCVKHNNHYNYRLLQSAKSCTHNAPKCTIFRAERMGHSFPPLTPFGASILAPLALYHHPPTSTTSHVRQIVSAGVCFVGKG